MDLREVSKKLEEIEGEISRVFVGQEEVLASVLAAIFARGHVLLEGVPGVGKTLLVRTLGIVLGCHFRRVQFTPDLMPSDVTGSTLYNSQKASFEFKHGPIFTHLLLADEVNRAPAKTQSAMLEAMAERSVTVDGVTHPLPEPFFVLATQNPLESAGTYALPEAQLDRFLFKVLIDHPSRDVEELLLRNVRDGFDASRLEAVSLARVTTPEIVIAMQDAIAQQVRVDDQIISYIASLVANTRHHRAVQIGASPRAGIALLQVGRVEAAMNGRDFVVPDDVKMHGAAVLRHRLILQPDAEIEGVTTDEVIQAVLHDTQVPGMGETRSEEQQDARRSPENVHRKEESHRHGDTHVGPRPAASSTTPLSSRSVGSPASSASPGSLSSSSSSPSSSSSSSSSAAASFSAGSAAPSSSPASSGLPAFSPSPNSSTSPAHGIGMRRSPDGSPLRSSPRRLESAPPGLPADRAQIPGDVTLLNVEPAPLRPSHTSAAPQGSGEARPAGLDPDTIPPAGPKPFGGRSGGQGEGDS